MYLLLWFQFKKSDEAVKYEACPGYRNKKHVPTLGVPRHLWMIKRFAGLSLKWGRDVRYNDEEKGMNIKYYIY